ncbi:hypothetical protein BGZ99_008324 [Dissophora globulifera]|uniref:Uncharacterized protein n=1 Tax=Dissophora globulifera TaxID=979702 RepID=A0A9P6RVD9_9FUNG|nr:hypothetical protein BGZ99_008324 [Dissophora globulifera]
MNSNTGHTDFQQQSRTQSPMTMPGFAESHYNSSNTALPRRGPHAYFGDAERDSPKGSLSDTETRSTEFAHPAFHDAKLASGKQQMFNAYNPYPSPPTSSHVVYNPTIGGKHQLPIAQQFHQTMPASQQQHFLSQPIPQAGLYQSQLSLADQPEQLADSSGHLPPPPRAPLPPPPPLSDLGFPQSYPDQQLQQFQYMQLQQQQQQPSSPISPKAPMAFPSPPQPATRYYSQPFQSYQTIPQQIPGSPTTSTGSILNGMHAHSANNSQNIDTTSFSLHTSLSNLSLGSSTSLAQSESHRDTAKGSGSSIVHRPASTIGSTIGSTTGKATAPVVRAVMDIKTAEVLSSLTFEDMPRCYVVAPPSGSASSGNYAPFRILAPCQALGVRDHQREFPVHFPDHPGYTVNNTEQMMKAHGTVLQHMANLACLVTGACDPAFGKGLIKHADKFLKTVKQTTRVPAPRDTPELGTGVDSTSLQIEKFMTEHLQLESIAQLMRDVTGSNLASNWSSGLQKMVSPGTGRAMWVCQECFSGLQSGRYEWNDEQASLDDLIGFPDKSGVKSEALLLNAVAIDVYSMMMRGQSRIKNAIINLSPSYFEQPERKAAAIFAANQKLIQTFAKTISEAHLTMVEINANQARDSELMDKDNIYLHVRRLFVCYQLEYVKLSGLPYLLREKLPGFLNHAKALCFDGVLLDNDKAITNMKKLITENSDMEHLVLTRAQMTSTGLKVLCTAHKNLRRLTKLDLSYNRLDAEGVKDLATLVLPTSLDIRFLDLSENPSIGSLGCLSLINSIWPISLHTTRQKKMISLQLANTGFCDESAKLLSRNIDGPNGVGVLYNLNLSGNQISKPGLLALMNTISQNANTSPLRKISLIQHASANLLPASMDFETVHLLGVHPTLTHLTISKISLGMVAQVVNLNKSLLSLIVDDVICASSQDHNYSFTSFQSLCHSIASNNTLQDLKIRIPWSLWTLVFPATNAGEQELNWATAAGWMSVMESSLLHNMSLRCFQMRGVTNFEEELILSGSTASVSAGSVGRYGVMPGMNSGEATRTPGENKMCVLSQSLRTYLERNQVLFYGRKHGIEAQLISQY